MNGSCICAGVYQFTVSENAKVVARERRGEEGRETFALLLSYHPYFSSDDLRRESQFKPILSHVLPTRQFIKYIFSSSNQKNNNNDP